MSKLFLFMMVSVDGFFEGPNHDLSWHNTDEEFADFAVEQTSAVGTILFGRKTYQMMADFWPTDEAKASDPQTAQLMNDLPKVVFSHTLLSAEWQNSRLVSTDAVTAVQQLKKESEQDLAIFGSSDLCVSLIPSGVIDEFRLMVNPVVLTQGTRLFEGLQDQLNLDLMDNRVFSNGNILLTYSPK